MTLELMQHESNSAKDSKVQPGQTDLEPELRTPGSICLFIAAHREQIYSKL